MTVTGRFHRFTPEDDARDVAARTGWPLPWLLDESEGSWTGWRWASGCTAATSGTRSAARPWDPPDRT
jgi:hypothetical protein